MIIRVSRYGQRSPRYAGGACCEYLPTRGKLVLRFPVLRRYFAYYRANRRPRSVLRHETSWHVLQPILGAKRLDEITPFDLERYRRDRKQARKTDVTINRELAFLRHVYSMAITWGKTTDNPVKKVRFARENNGRIRLLTPEEEGRLLTYCAPHLKPIILTALHTGFRTSELLSLTWADVDFARGVITVRAAYVKNSESRSIPMNDVLTATLKAVKIESDAGEAVFHTPQGRPCRNFRTAFEQAVQKAGLEDFTFHDLRHTFASRLAMVRVDLPTVKELLGHKSIAMTLRYTQLSTDHKQRAVRALEQFAEKVPAIFPTAPAQDRRSVS
jgi:integrase